MNKGNKTSTIIGYVGETEDDDSIRLTIFSGEEDYLVEMNQQGKKLLQVLDFEVKATGQIKQNKDGRNVFCIKKFEIIDDDFDDGDSDDYNTHGDDRYKQDDWID